ncbi:MAG: zinc dependent phospholipase C family protein [Cyclobacteriaceae bacterium]
MRKVCLLLTVFLLLQSFESVSWGFFAHKLINRHAVFSLPPEMIGFFKKHIDYVTENAVNPDRRRYAVEGEAPRHYIDIDHYGDSAIYKMPRYWFDAVEKYTEDSLQAYGIVPWHVNFMKFQLTEAFKEKDVPRILRLAADMGHYIADSNVPLHTTENYNGQLTGQHGIHGFWESRLPELFANQYDFFIGQAEYIEKPQLMAWQSVTKAHLALDTVLTFEKRLTSKFPKDKKYSFEERGASFVQVYSTDFSRQYHNKLDGMVERRMKASIKMVADFWFTCWVDAGQPDLSEIGVLTAEEEQNLEQEQKSWINRIFQGRDHESGN